MLQSQLLPVPVNDWPNDFVCSASELDLVKDIGAIEVLQLLLFKVTTLIFDLRNVMQQNQK